MGKGNNIPVMDVAGSPSLTSSNTLLEIRENSSSQTGLSLKKCRLERHYEERLGTHKQKMRKELTCCGGGQVQKIFVGSRQNIVVGIFGSAAV
jgi:hypothetical protein